MNRPGPSKSDVFDLSGALIVAHPELKDANFLHSVVLIAAHTPTQGAVGVIINQPCNKTLGQVDEQAMSSDLRDLQVYEGGPVDKNRLMIMAWEWLDNNRFFKLTFDISSGEAVALMKDKNMVVRGFLGHAIWQAGQLESELMRGAWVITQMKPNIVIKDSGRALWEKLLLAEKPELKLLVHEVQDPSMN